VPDAGNPDAEVPLPGCYTTGSWSATAFEGAPYSSASAYGTSSGQDVGRAQLIRLRENHEFSLDSYSEEVRGPAAASSWMWHAVCADGGELYSDWQTITDNVFFASGCADGVETTSFRVRVRAASDELPCDPDAGL
jgi:hypothetical protein